VKIKRASAIIDSFPVEIPTLVIDSIRHLRECEFKRKILLSDTIYMKIENEPLKKVYGFNYHVHPQFAKFSHNWACSFDELVIDGVMKEGVDLYFEKKGFNFINRKDFKSYY
jgi:hypothetical protein